MFQILLNFVHFTVKLPQTTNQKYQKKITRRGRNEQNDVVESGKLKLYNMNYIIFDVKVL